MTHGKSGSRDGVEAPEGELLRWRAHLLRRRPARSLALVAALAAGLGVVQVAYRSTGLTLVSAVLLVGALSQFFFPIDYVITTRGVHTRHLGFFGEFVPWDDLAGWRLQPDCLVLPRRRRRRRGAVVLYFQGDPESIVREVETRLPETKSS